jgi:hypothetical protein
MSTSLNMLEVLGMESRAITQQLNDQFPQITPTPDDSIEKIMYRSGQRSVVEWLLTRMET